MAPAVWGGTYLLFTETLPATHPLTVGAYRSLIGGLLLFAVVRPARPARADRARVLWLSLTNVTFFSAFLFLGASRLGGGLAATLIATQPMVATLVAWPLLGHRPTPLGLGRALVGVAGVALLVGTADTSPDLLGVLAALGAAGSMGTGTVLLKRWQRLGTPEAVGAWQLIAGGALLVPAAVALEGPPPVPDIVNIAGFALLCTIGTAWSFAVWTRGARALGEDAAFLGLLSPLVATCLGAWVLDEHLVGLQPAGAALVLLAAAAGALGARTKPMSTRRSGASLPSKG